MFVEGPEIVEAAADLGDEVGIERTPRPQLWVTDSGSEEDITLLMVLICWNPPSDCALEAAGFTFSLSNRTFLVLGVVGGGVGNVARTGALIACV